MKIITELYSLEHDIAEGSDNSLVMIDSTHFILAYAGTGLDGRIKTFSIDGSYNITEIDSLEHDTDRGVTNSLVMIDPTHFMLAYAGIGNDGFIKTFSIDGDYNITEVDSLEHDTAYGIYNSLVMIDSTHFMLAHSGTGYNGYIKTFSIDGSYNITEVDSLNHDTECGHHNSLVMIDSTHFMLAYSACSYDGHLKTFSIDGSYNITEIDSLNHDTDWGMSNSLIMIDPTHFMLAYSAENNDGYIKTFSIDGDYNITEIGNLEYDTDWGYHNSLVMIDSTHFMLAYMGTNDDGFIKTFSIDGNYNITEVDSLEHDTDRGHSNSLVMIDPTHFMLAYAGAGYDGYIKTFSYLDEDPYTTIAINETDRSDLLMANTLSINDESNHTPSTMVCDIKAELAEAPVVDQEVEIVNNDVVIFAGNIQRVSIKVLGDEAFYSLECVDYNRILDRRLVVESYEDKTDAFIINDILEKYTGGSGITAGNVSGDNTIGQMTFNYMPPSQCFTEICKLTGSSWYIDYDKDVHYFSLADVSSPHSITDDSNFEKDLVISKDNTKVRNKIFVRGGTYLSDFTTIYQEADGDQTVFNLPDKPHDFSMTQGGGAKTVGIKHVDDPADFDYMLNYQEKYVEATGAAPGAGTTMAFTFKYDVPVLVGVQDNSSVTDVGLFEYAIFDSKIKTLDQARARAEAELLDYADTIIEGSFSTLTEGWRAGQTIHIKNTELNLDADYLIRSVKMTSLGGGSFISKIKLASTETLGIIQYLINLIETDKLSARVTENEVVDEIFSPTAANVVVTDSVIATDFGATPYLFGTAIFGLSEFSA